jgi:hypothetical protein
MKVTFHDHVCKQHASAFRCGGIHHEFRFQPTLIHAHAHAHDGAMYSELGAQRMRLNKAKKGLPNKKGNCCQPIPAHPDASASKKNAAQDYAASQPIRWQRHPALHIYSGFGNSRGFKLGEHDFGMPQLWPLHFVNFHFVFRNQGSTYWPNASKNQARIN